jgi:hypothetical protein
VRDAVSARIALARPAAAWPRSIGVRMRRSRPDLIFERRCPTRGAIGR